jgi:hypothetical protein
MVQVDLTQDEADYILIWANYELGEPHLKRNYANIVNSIYHKLKGKDNSNWVKNKDHYKD